MALLMACAMILGGAVAMIAAALLAFLVFGPEAALIVLIIGGLCTMNYDTTQAPVTVTCAQQAKD